MVRILLFLILLNFNLLAQSFSASVSRNPVSVGERFELTFSTDQEGTNFRAPDIRNFQILSGPNTSQSVSIVNGQMSRSVSYTYILQAQKEGEFEISPATLTVNGNKVKSNPLKIKVIPESEAQKQRRLAKEQQKKDFEQQVQDLLEANLFIVTNVSKKTVHVGEQLVATYKLFINPRLNLIDLSPDKTPQLNGFWTQDLEIGNFQWSDDTYDGKRYKSAVLKKVVLIPQQDGKLEIDRYSFNSIVRVPVQNNRSRRDPFGMFDDFFGSYKDVEYSISSNKVSINAKALPSPEPITYTGGVGNFEMEAWFDRTKTSTGEPVTLKIKISGSGNLQLIESPDIEFPPGFEKFEPKTIDNINVTGAGISGTRTFEQLVIPRNPGDFEIEPIEFTFYDLKSNSYKTLKSEKFILNVSKGEGNSGSDYVSGIKKEDVELLGKDIRFIKTEDVDLDKSKNNLFGSFLFWVLLLAPYAFFVGFLIYRDKKGNESFDQIRNKKALKVAKKKLSTAKSLLSTGNDEKFYEEMTKAIWGYFSDKLVIPVSELTKDNTLEKMSGKVDENLAKGLIEVLDNCEYARYAPSAVSSSKEDLFHKAEELITKIEGSLK